MKKNWKIITTIHKQCVFENKQEEKLDGILYKIFIIICNEEYYYEKKKQETSKNTDTQFLAKKEEQT